MHVCVKTVLTLAITERGRNSIVHQCRCSNRYLYSYGYSNSYWCGRPIKFGLNRIKVCGVPAFWDFYNQLFCIHPSDSWLFSCSSVCLVTIVCGGFILSSVWACVWVSRRWKVGYFFHSSGFWGSLAPGLASASVFMCDSIMQQAPAVYLVSPSVVRVPESLFLHSLTLRPCLRTKMFSYRNTQ